MYVFTYGDVLGVAGVHVMLLLTRLDVLDLRNASQAGSIVTLAALTGRELVETADLATERAFALDVLVGLRHDWDVADVDCCMCETYKSLLKKRVSGKGKGCSRANWVEVGKEERWEKGGRKQNK